MIVQPPHPKLRDDIIDFYSAELLKETGFDYRKQEQVYSSLGNTPGVYPDTLLLFSRLIKTYNLKKVVELGSGFSTLFFTHLGVELSSFEQKPEYLELTKQLLAKNNLPNNHISLKENITPITGSSLEAACLVADLIFVDCLDRKRWLTDPTWLYNSPIVIVDDMEFFGDGVLFDFMFKTKRPFFITYNGGGRTDRTEFISYKFELTPDIKEVVAKGLGYL